MDEKVSFKNFKGMEIRGIISYPEEGKKFPVVIVSHGFLSYKENKLLYHIARKLAENGIAALRFDFSGCIGESEGSCNDILLSHEIEDLVSAINFLEENEKIDDSKVGLVGHSLGGLVSIVVASNDKRIKSLVSVSAPAKLEWQHVFSEEFVEMWKHDQKAKFKSDKKGEVEIDFSFYKDFAEYDAERIISKLEIPTRIIHGNRDSVVELRNAEALFAATKSKKDLRIVSGGNHLFLKKEFSDEVSSLVSEWMKENLV